MRDEFRREYLLRLPLPLAQLYGRTYNAKSARERHDNAFYLVEALVKLIASTATAGYLDEVSLGPSPRVPVLDRLLAQLALPSLGQWLGILRELAKYFATRVDSASHPWGSLNEQLTKTTRDEPALLALYQRIKNGPDGSLAADQSCSLIGVLDALVQYRNAVFGHGAGRFESFYADEMGPLLFPAVNEMLAEGRVNLLGVPQAKLVYITELRVLDQGRTEAGLRELVGTQGERLAPLELTSEQATKLLPNRVAIMWPGRAAPLRLDPLLQYRESDLAEEVLFLNRDRNGRQVEYLSYTTGRTERDRSMLPALAELLSQVTNRTVDQTQLERMSEQSFSETPSVESLFADPPAPTQEIGEYELLVELGRGGMGVVYLARQKSLGRLVALKMLPGDLGADEVSLARFKREIRHLARCDNPHIVKVLDSGTFQDGRIYYTMEYVPGSDLEMVWRELTGMQDITSVATWGNSTWQQAVLAASRKQRSKAESSRSGKAQVPTEPTNAPAEIPLPLPPLPDLPNVTDDPGGYIRRVVTLARDVARALQTIHDQGIIHRDVKPANLMLTPDGTRVVLMDFGLAKGQTQSLSASRQGGLLGTLRYAAPEQLAAANIKVGPAADVRGLGVTLWELLTRQRLFGAAEDEARLTQEVLTSDIPRLRSIDSKFDRDLEAIVARATERRITDRIASAGQLADLLQLWLDGKPLSIRPPGSGELLRRWVREHRLLVAAGAAACLSIIAISGVAFIKVTNAKELAEQALGASQRHADLAMNTLQTVIYDMDNELANRPEVVEVRRKLLAKAHEGLIKISNDLADDDRVDTGKLAVHMQLARVFAHIGNSDGLGGLERAEEHFVEAQKLAKRLLEDYPAINGLRTLLSEISNSLGDGCLQLGRIDEAQKHFESSLAASEAAAKSDPSDNNAQRSLSVSYSRLGRFNLQLGRLREAQSYFVQDLAIAEALAKATPEDSQARADLSYTYQFLGRASLQDERVTQSLEYFAKDLAIMEALHQDDPVRWQASLSYSHSWMGQADLRAGNLSAARQHFEKRLSLARLVANADAHDFNAQAEVAYAHHWLGRVCQGEGQLETATQHHEQSSAILKQLVDAAPSNVTMQSELAKTYGALGEIHLQGGRLSDANRLFEQSSAICRDLIAAQPSDASLQQYFTSVLNCLGDVSSRLGNLDKAGHYYDEALAIRKQLVATGLSDATFLSDIANSYRASGDIDQRRGQHTRAVEAYQQSQSILTQLISADPKNSQADASLAATYHCLGSAYISLGQLDLANTAFTTARDIHERLAAADTQNLTLLRSLATSYYWIGRVKLSSGQLLEAQTAFLKDLELSERIAQAAADNADAQAELSSTYNWLQRVSMDLGDTTAALDYGGRCVALLETLVAADPPNANKRAELAKAYSLMGDLKMTTSDPIAAKEHFLKSREISSALVTLDSINANYKDTLAYVVRRFGNACYDQKEAEEARRHFNEAIAIYEQLIAGGIDSAATRRELATTLRWRGRVDFEANEFANALPFFEKDVQLSQAVFDASPDLDAQDNLCYSYSWLGSTRMSLKQIDKAFQPMTRWVEIADQRFRARPNNSEVKADYLNALDNMADLFREKKQYNEAITKRNEILRINPENASAYNLRGHIYFDLHDWKNAIADYSKAIEIDPADAMFWRNRSNTHLQAQELPEAQRDIAEALRMSPDNADFKEIAQKIADALAKP